MKLYTKLYTVALFSVLALSVSACRLSINFHEVDPGKFYRSAQLTGEEFQIAIDQVGIRTIINLRGEGPGEAWFEDEEAVASRNGVQLVNIGMSARRFPHREDLLKLLDTLETADRPILVHCQMGADRTGEASAIYQMLYQGKTKAQAMKMLSPVYYHIEALMPAKDAFVRIFKGRDWAYDEYDPCLLDTRYYNHEKFCLRKSMAKIKER